MTIADRIELFPDLRAALESSKAIAGDLKFLAEVMWNTSKVAYPAAGQVVYLARILARLRENLNANAKPIRDLEAELAASHEEPVQAGDDVRACAACWAIDLATAIQDQLTLIFGSDGAVREIAEEDSSFVVSDFNDIAFIVAVALAAVPESHIDEIETGLGPYWTDLSRHIRESRDFQEKYRTIMLPKIVTSLKQTLGSPAAMEDLEAAIDQEFAKAADRRTRATGIQNSMRPAKPGPSEPDDPNGDRPPSTMAEWNQRLERFCKTRVPHQVANLKVAIHILKRENRRFKTEELLKLDPSLSEGPLKQALAAATKEGVLTNRSDKKPRGYGLPEWDWRCREYVPEYVLTNPNEIGGDESTNLSTY